MNDTVPAAFLSYSHFDDEHDGQYITQFRALLEREVRAQTGRDFRIFQDWRDIPWGQPWRDRIEEAIDSVTFLLPVLSPNFFTSPECCREVKRFLEREQALDRNDLILPVYYIDCGLLKQTDAAQHDLLTQLINSRQYADWRPLRRQSLESQEVWREVARLARSISAMLSAVPAARPHLAALYAACPELKNLFRQLPVAVGELRAWCHQAMPSDVPIPIPADYDTLDLLEWLAGKGQLAGGQVPLLSVLRQLQPLPSDVAARNRLEQAIQWIASRFGGVATQILPEPTPAMSQNAAALMLEIWPTAGNRCNVHGRLFYSAERIRSVYVREKNDKEDTRLNLDDENDLTGLVEDLRKLLVDYSVDEDNVIVEFFLPQELLSRAVEQWIDEFDDPLGTCLPVVVRPRHCLRERARQMGLQHCWNHLQAQWEKPFPEGFWWFTGFEETQRRQVRGKLQEGVCIVLGFVPDVAAPSRQNAVLYLLHVGTPIALWTRREDNLADFDQELRALLQNKPLKNLPGIIRDMRHKLWKDKKESVPCYHLTLLWDDPGRCLDKPVYQAPV